MINSTLSARTPPTPFDAPNFLDTIKSYIDESRTLGWIANQATADKYTRLVDSARSNLDANNRGITKAKLDSVLLSANADSSSTLTSEAYALLRFNTEYVLKKLREEDSMFAAEKKSSSWDATSTNSARHLAKSGSYLHGVFVSGGEIVYRRSTDGGSSWNPIRLLNTAFGDNSHPCIAATQSGSVEIVWQRQRTPSTYEVWHVNSQDSGGTWSTAAVLPGAGEVQLSQYQTEGPMPVVTEQKDDFLVVVYCSSDGLRYRVSDDGGSSWETPDPDIISGQADDRVRYPALAGAHGSGSASYVSLLYDYAGDDNGPYSRTFEGSTWGDEMSAGEGIGATGSAFSSVAIDADNNPIAAWTGYPGTTTSKIIFRAGYNDNSWSDWFVEFGVGGNLIDWYYPSVTYYQTSQGEYGVAIVNMSSANEIELIRFPDGSEPAGWAITTVSESGAWANITQEEASSGNPVYCWTDQSTSPYEIVVGSSEEFSPRRRAVSGATNLVRKRRAVVEDRTVRGVFSVEFGQMKVVRSSGDTATIPFKQSSLRQRGITLSNVWDYLGSDTVNVPSNARRLVVAKQFTSRGPSIGERKFSLRVLNTSGVQIGVLDTSSTSGTISVDIAQYAGMRVILRPHLTLSGINSETVDVSVGDVYTIPGEEAKSGKVIKNRKR